MNQIEEKKMTHHYASLNFWSIFVSTCQKTCVLRSVNRFVHFVSPSVTFGAHGLYVRRAKERRFIVHLYIYRRIFSLVNKIMNYEYIYHRLNCVKNEVEFRIGSWWSVKYIFRSESVKSRCADLNVVQLRINETVSRKLIIGSMKLTCPGSSSGKVSVRRNKIHINSFF